MKLFKVILLFLSIYPLIGLADITWEVFKENISFIPDPNDTVFAFIARDDDANEASEKFKTEIGNEAMYIELLKKTLESTVQENIEKLLSTNNGRTLLEKINDELNKKNAEITKRNATQKEKEGLKKINFRWCTDGVSADTVSLKVFLDPFDLYSATDFYLINDTIEKETRPDAYFFHELVHLYHALEGTKFTDLYEKQKSKLVKFKEHFPDDSNKDLDSEELETITVIPSSMNGEGAIICENSYRQEKNLQLRLNILDGNKEELPTNAQINTDLKEKIEEAKAQYLPFE